jgi:excisionase family DNA binding protein
MATKVLTGWATVLEAAEALKLSERSVQRYVAAGQIPAERIGHTIRVPRWWLDARRLAEPRAVGVDVATGSAAPSFAAGSGAQVGSGSAFIERVAGPGPDHNDEGSRG